MSKAVLVLLILLSLGAHAKGGDGPADGGSDSGSSTEADSAAVKACFGGCESDNFQRTLYENPYETDLKYKEIFTPRGVMTPEQLQKSNATKDKPIDI